MFLSGKQIIKNRLVSELIDTKSQVQPCGIDFTLKRLAVWESVGSLDFDNTKRILPQTKKISFDKSGKIKLQKGGYLVEFNEMVNLPKNIMATVQSRSSLFRCGANIIAGVIDPGYKGAVGGLLQVWNDSGIILYRNAKLVQWVFVYLEETVEVGYSGRYQGNKTII